jgi:YfiH family protein
MRAGGVSVGSYSGLNLGSHVGDDDVHVAANRRLLCEHLPAEPVWLNQVHGIDVVDAANAGMLATADASCTRAAGQVCVVLTADCLPVLFCSEDGTVVAAAHAGWRGLAGGVLERTLEAMRVPGNRVLAWLGPAIGPAAFEVGEDVRDVFVEGDRQAALAFSPQGQGKYLADIYRLARMRLNSCGIEGVFGGDFCTVADPARFYSYRRDRITGRQASLIWLD